MAFFAQVALLAEGVDRNLQSPQMQASAGQVALLAEGVDRNLKIFNGLTGKHSRWEIWEDFVTLTAIEISNSTDKVNATERTKMYQTIISKYSAKERDGMAEMLAEVVMGMEQNPDQDFLGSLYMMCELGNDHAGQFFTPYDVCRCMAEITFNPKLHPDM